MKNKLNNNKQKSFYFQNFINNDNKNNTNSSYSLFNSRANFLLKFFLCIFNNFIKTFISWH